MQGLQFTSWIGYTHVANVVTGERAIYDDVRQPKSSEGNRKQTTWTDVCRGYTPSLLLALL